MKNFEKYLELIKSHTFIIALFDLLFIVVPGSAVIFMWDAGLFIALDWVKLVLLSTAITTPLLFINTMAIDGISGMTEKDTNKFFVSFSMSSILTGIIIYVSLGICYLVKGEFLLKYFLSLLIVSEIVGLISVWLEERKIKKSLNR